MKSTILAIIEKHIESELFSIREHDQIASILAPLEGKPINWQTLNKKRLSAFEAENGYTFTLVSEYGMYHIQGKLEHLIGYTENPFICLSNSSEYGKRGFEYFDNCYSGAAKERIEKLQNMDIEKTVAIFSSIRDNFEKLRELFGDLDRAKLGSFNNPVYHEILNSIYKNDKNDGLKLSDFYYIQK